MHEWPKERNLSRARDAFWKYAEKAPMEVIPSPDPDDFSRSIGRPTAFEGKANDFFKAQTIKAERLTRGILDSELKHRLCKCRCGMDAISCIRGLATRIGTALFAPARTPINSSPLRSCGQREEACGP